MKKSLAALRNPYRNGREVLKQFTDSNCLKGTEDNRMDSPESENSEILREHTPQPPVTSAASSSQSPRQSQPPLNTIAGQWGTFRSTAFGGVQGQSHAVLTMAVYGICRCQRSEWLPGGEWLPSHWLLRINWLPPGRNDSPSERSSHKRQCMAGNSNTSVAINAAI